MIGDPASEQHRGRIGFLILAAGILLLLWAWGNWFFRVSMPTKAETVARPARDERAASEDEARDVIPPAKVFRTLPFVLVVGFILVLLFLFGSYVLLRMSRHYRAAGDRERAPPSDARDAWAMHKVPDGYDDENEEP